MTLNRTELLLCTAAGILLGLLATWVAIAAVLE